MLAATFSLSAPVIAGCGQEQGEGSGVTPSDPPSEITITVTVDRDAAPTTWRLRCDPFGGDHPNPTAACLALNSTEYPFAPVPADRMCAQIYGGPHTAIIAGTWHGQQVHAEYNRTDGCEIERWDKLADVFGQEV